jgi:tetratricopeptide (TPR) repeat protein
MNLMSHESAAEALLARARDVVSRGDWQEGYDLFVEIDSRTPLSAQDLALLADAAYAAGHFEVTITSWERAYAQSERAGDHLAAAGAAVRVAMHLLFDTALMAPVRSWARRVEQLLEGLDETPIHAWLAVVRNYERLLSGDFQEARRWARKAIDTGTSCAPAAAAIGRVAEARSLILEGDVSNGLALLNEAALAAVSGDLDPLFTGIVYCEVVCALQALAQYDLAEQWTEAMERWRQGQPVGSIHGRCRVH